MRRFGLAVVAGLTLIGTAQAQDVAGGENVFKKCRACHHIGPNAKNAVGPELNGIFGRKSGMAPGFNYSNANKNSGITWNEENFAEYIQDPRKFMPGNKMAFAGVKDKRDVADLIAFLKQFKADGSK